MVYSLFWELWYGNYGTFLIISGSTTLKLETENPQVSPHAMHTWRPSPGTLNPKPCFMWVVVKIRVPFWVPNMVTQTQEKLKQEELS